MSTLSIGRLARETGVTVDAVRFYERKGILAEPERRASGYRMYTQADVERVRLVKRLQALGFTLAEVIDALEPFDAGTATCQSELWRLEAVGARLDAKMAEFAELRDQITRLLELCNGGGCTHADHSPADCEMRA